jgi:hypothetical protein
VADRKNAWTAITAPTHTLASLATSSTLVAGRESNTLDFTSTKYLDAQARQKVTTGTGPSAGTIELWAVPSIDGTNFPDVFDGTDSAETVTSRDILYGSAKLIASTPTDTTSDRAYELNCTSLRDVFGTLPQKLSFFVTHSTGVNLNSTEGNHDMALYGTYETIA